MSPTYSSRIFVALFVFTFILTAPFSWAAKRTSKLELKSAPTDKTPAETYDVVFDDTNPTENLFISTGEEDDPYAIHITTDPDTDALHVHLREYSPRASLNTLKKSTPKASLTFAITESEDDQARQVSMQLYDVTTSGKSTPLETMVHLTTPVEKDHRLVHVRNKKTSALVPNVQSLRKALDLLNGSSSEEIEKLTSDEDFQTAVDEAFVSVPSGSPFAILPEGYQASSKDKSSRKKLPALVYPTYDASQTVTSDNRAKTVAAAPPKAEKGGSVLVNTTTYKEAGKDADEHAFHFFHNKNSPDLGYVSNRFTLTAYPSKQFVLQIRSPSPEQRVLSLHTINPGRNVWETIRKGGDPEDHEDISSFPGEASSPEQKLASPLHLQIKRDGSMALYDDDNESIATKKGKRLELPDTSQPSDILAGIDTLSAINTMVQLKLDHLTNEKTVLLSTQTANLSATTAENLFKDSATIHDAAEFIQPYEMPFTIGFKGILGTDNINTKALVTSGRAENGFYIGPIKLKNNLGVSDQYISYIQPLGNDGYAFSLLPYEDSLSDSAANYEQDLVSPIVSAHVSRFENSISLIVHNNAGQVVHRGNKDLDTKWVPAEHRVVLYPQRGKQNYLPGIGTLLNILPQFLTANSQTPVTIDDRHMQALLEPVKRSGTSDGYLYSGAYRSSVPRNLKYVPHIQEGFVKRQANWVARKAGRAAYKPVDYTRKHPYKVAGGLVLLTIAGITGYYYWDTLTGTYVLVQDYASESAAFASRQFNRLSFGAVTTTPTTEIVPPSSGLPSSGLPSSGLPSTTSDLPSSGLPSTSASPVSGLPSSTTSASPLSGLPSSTTSASPLSGLPSSTTSASPLSGLPSSTTSASPLSGLPSSSSVTSASVSSSAVQSSGSASLSASPLSASPLVTPLNSMKP
ncbi:hypothetical protein PAHA111176_02980 [Parendozoicomonas haliclonae]